MESNSVVIGKEVLWQPKNLLADIVNYEKGWVTIKTDDGEEHKARAKDLVLMDSVDDLAENDKGELVTVEPAVDPSLPSSANVSGATGEAMEINCSCGEIFVPKKSESVNYPKCGKWHRVRLHPDLTKYVKGMAETASGRDTVDIDDEVATMLRGLSLDDLYPAIYTELDKLSEKARFSPAMTAAFVKSGMSCSDFLLTKYELLNPGMQRMNLGNLLRGAIKRQDVINHYPVAVKEGENEQ